MIHTLVFLYFLDNFVAWFKCIYTTLTSMYKQRTHEIKQQMSISVTASEVQWKITQSFTIRQLNISYVITLVWNTGPAGSLLQSITLSNSLQSSSRTDYEEMGPWAQTRKSPPALYTLNETVTFSFSFWTFRSSIYSKEIHLIDELSYDQQTVSLA